MEVVSARLSQCNQLPYMEVKVVVHCKDSAKSCICHFIPTTYTMIN